MGIGKRIADIEIEISHQSVLDVLRESAGLAVCSEIRDINTAAVVRFISVHSDLDNLTELGQGDFGAGSSSYATMREDIRLTVDLKKVKNAEVNGFSGRTAPDISELYK